MAKGKYEYWLSKEGLIQIEGWARDGLTDEQIAFNMGITRSTLADWKKKYSDISDTLKKNKDIADRRVENALYQRALGYKTTEIIKERIDDTGQKQRHKNGIELTEKQWEIAKNYFGNVCCYCGKKTKLTKDHIVPLHKGGRLCMENVIPCCTSCNSSKRDNNIWEWYRKQPFYEKEREKKINDYLVFVAAIENIFHDSDTELAVTKEITRFVPPDTTAQIFWLKNRKPDVWREKKVLDCNIQPNEDWFDADE